MIKSRIFKFILFSLIFLISFNGIKAQGYSDLSVLDSLVQIALENNPEILSSKFAKQAMDYRARASGTIPDPKFNIAALNLPRSSLSLDETPMSGIVLGISQTIPWPGQLKAKSAVAHLQSDSKEQNIYQTENSIARMVKYYYYEYSYWTKAGQLLDSNIELIQFLINTAEIKYANGNGTAQDALRAQTARARLENKKLFMSQMSQTALLNIAQLINDSALIYSKILANLPDNLSKKPFNSGLNNPALTKAKIQSSISNKELSLARSGYYPNFSFGFDYRIRKDVPMDAVRGEDFISIKAGFQLPLWFFARQNNETKAARYALRASEENYNSIKNRLKQQISAAQLVITTLFESLERYDNSIRPQAIATYEAAKAAYEVGQVDFNALLSAQLDLFTIEMERIELLKNYCQKSAELQELNGER